MISTLVSAGVAASEAGSVLHQSVTSFYRKLYIADEYRPSSVLHSSTRVTLVRAADSLGQVESLGEDYGLHTIYDGQVSVHVVDGTHESFITEANNSSHLARLFDTVLTA